MNKLRVGFYSHTVDFAGTWRSHERLAQEVSNNDGFKTFVLYCENIENNRLAEARLALPKTTFVPFARSLEKTGFETGYTPRSTNFSEVARSLNLDVLHFARTGYYEWPFTERLAKLQVETNIFGCDDTSPFLDKSIAIASVLTQIKKRPADAVIPNPIPGRSPDYDSLSDLRQELGYSTGDVVLGRIGRPANFHPAALESFAALSKSQKNLRYLIVGGCEEAKRFVSSRGLDSVVTFVPPTNDDVWIERFHKTVDVFAHYRSDGEIHSTAIAQAMMYDIPVVTHRAGLNGQIETVGPGGYCATNEDDYLGALRGLTLCSPERRKMIGTKGRRYTEDRSEQKLVGGLVASKYLDWSLSP